MQYSQSIPSRSGLPRFRSLRFRALLPVFLALTAGAILVVFLFTGTLARSLHNTQVQSLKQDAGHAVTGLADFGRAQRDTLHQVVTLESLRSLLLMPNSTALQRVVEPLATQSDFLFVARPDLQILLGLQRGGSRLEAVRNASLTSLSFVNMALRAPGAATSGIVQTDRGYAVLTAETVMDGNTIRGIVVSGVLIKDAAFALHLNSGTTVAFYGQNGELLFNPFGDVPASALTIPPNILRAIPSVEGDPLVSETTVFSGRYTVAYLPLVLDTAVLGWVGLYHPNSWLTATETGRTVLSLTLSALVAFAMLILYLVLHRQMRRVEQITQVAHDLRRGDNDARTRMLPTDEIGELGFALDFYARHEQEIRSHLNRALHTQAQEIVRLEGVVDSVSTELKLRESEMSRLIDQASNFDFDVFRQQPVNLESVLWILIADWQLYARKHQVALQLLVNTPGLFVLAETWRLSWALGALIETAVKGAARNDCITLVLSADDADQHARLLFRDTRIRGKRLKTAQNLIEGYGGHLEWMNEMSLAVLLPLTSEAVLHVTQSAAYQYHLPQD